MAADRFSLWAVPCAADAPIFAEVIQRLARVESRAPFPPHITLVGSVGAVDAAEGLAAVAASTPAFPLQLTQVEHSDEVFRCITLAAVAETPLLELREALARACGQPELPAYAPHLSLLYGALPLNERQQLAHGVDIALPLTITIDAVHLVDVSDEDWAQWSVVDQWALGGGAAA